MVNCNPETVSTDYDTSDRLYFEPLTAEDVLEIIHVEQSNGTLKGVIVQFGGQTPLKLAEPLEDAGVPILGTSPDAIDLAEDRERFKALLDKLKLKQPRAASPAARPRPASPPSASATRSSSARPTCWAAAPWRSSDDAELDRYIARLSATLDRPSELVVSDKRPLLIDRYLSDATEVDVDCLSDGKDVVHRRHHGAHRGGRRPLGRLRLLAAALLAASVRHRCASRSRPRTWPAP